MESGEQLARLLNGVLDQARADPLRAKLDVAPVRPADLGAVGGAGVERPCARDRRVPDPGGRGPDPVLSGAGRSGPGGADPGQPGLQRLQGSVSAGGRVTPAPGRASWRARPCGCWSRWPTPGRRSRRRIGARIFEAWDQTERGRLQGGAGAGLRACAQNLALMGGEIAVDPPNATLAASRGRTGRSSVLVRLRRADPSTPARAGADVDGTGREEIRILAAEDNVANRKVLALALENAPVALTFAEDGARAWIRGAARPRPDPDGREHAGAGRARRGARDPPRRAGGDRIRSGC
ncbi:hypothetical protein ACRAWD_03505 [Caulobacter segnis]